MAQAQSRVAHVPLVPRPEQLRQRRDTCPNSNAAIIYLFILFTGLPREVTVEPHMPSWDSAGMPVQTATQQFFLIFYWTASRGDSQTTHAIMGQRWDACPDSNAAIIYLFIYWTASRGDGRTTHAIMGQRWDTCLDINAAIIYLYVYFIYWTASRGDSRATPAIILTESMSLLQKSEQWNGKPRLACVKRS